MFAQQNQTSTAPSTYAVRASTLLASLGAPVIIITWWRSSALAGSPLQLFQVFDSLVVAASLVILVPGRRTLTQRDWLIALTAGAGLGVLVPSTGFYPLGTWMLGAYASVPALLAFAHGAGITIALLAGAVIMRRGGPVKLSTAKSGWKAVLASLGFGVLVGIPLAVLNAYATTLVQDRPWVLQTSFFPLVEALQPGIVEEVIYRFALLGIVWMALKPFWGRKAVWLAGTFTMLVHSYAHYGELLLDRPLMYLAFGAVLAIVWGLPLTILALRRDLEASVGFHWVQDALRFIGGL